MSSALDSRQRDRYSRQLMLEGFDDADQTRLLSSRVLVVGAGGLGSAVIQYLAAAGVGTIGVADDGCVTRSNLQRQVLHGVDDLEDRKVDSAARSVELLNPDVTVETHPDRVEPGTAPSLLEDYDVVVDGLDHFPGRFVCNDVARLQETPFVHGAVYGLEGQTMAFRPGGPCYRCLLPEAPDPGAVPSDEPMGIFPTLPGAIGCLQATEVLKLLLEYGTVLDDHLLRYDATDATLTKTALEPAPDCPVCGPDGVESVEDLAYDDRCRIER
ncbi:HesA/MoeB/ThiF family protein [Natrialbaceae archaeon AArc-T1-2]|uniref:HesA/MoeB/ThiF family protein n=1 Tax=Natrialbaceae archaeon AArc-T1-2 TaxID=3053904 RepID=UPI00255AE0D7|nr:HesA/MoeB/ThiF family protein [Natrialbaceae archaeon AArc-T1-2]WIV66638.1 HesA/MoeB/ThiF family protein [Natrialbaceae archaeon AArc-T1-2]